MRMKQSVYEWHKRIEKKLDGHIGQNIQIHRTNVGYRDSGFKGQGNLVGWTKLSDGLYSVELVKGYGGRDTITTYDVYQDYIYFNR